MTRSASLRRYFVAEDEERAYNAFVPIDVVCGFEALGEKQLAIVFRSACRLTKTCVAHEIRVGSTACAACAATCATCAACAATCATCAAGPAFFTE